MNFRRLLASYYNSAYDLIGLIGEANYNTEIADTSLTSAITSARYAA